MTEKIKLIVEVMGPGTPVDVIGYILMVMNPSMNYGRLNFPVI